MAVISSHALDGTHGTHAAGIAITLVNLRTGLLLFNSQTDNAGRLVETVSSSDVQLNDRFELCFELEGYWVSQGVSHTHRIDEIILRFAMPDTNARYHMPIIFSPNSYSTWSSLPE